MTATLDPVLVRRLTEQGTQPEPLFTDEASKLCEQCGRPFARRERTESAAAWAERRFCSQSCGARSRARRVPSDTRVCEACHDSFDRPPSLSRGEFARRRFCGPKCSRVGRKAAARRTKECGHCGGVSVQRPRETVKQFEERPYCGRRCGEQARAARSEAVRKVCARDGCDTVFERGQSRAWTFARRRYCGRSCAHLAAYGSDPASEPSRTCEHCGGAFRRRPGTESRTTFARRRFCGVPCAERHKQASRPEVVDSKPCEQCAALMYRNVGREGPKSWASRRFCSRDCTSASRRGTGEPKTARVSKPRRRRAQSVLGPVHGPALPPPERPLWRPASWGPLPVKGAV